MKKKSDAVFSDYMGTVQLASWRFQYVEEGLKMYIGTAYQIINKGLKAGYRFTIATKMFATCPLVV